MATHYGTTKDDVLHLTGAEAQLVERIGAGSDVVMTGSGDDRIVVDRLDNRLDVVFGGEGVDRLVIRYAGFESLQVTSDSTESATAGLLATKPATGAGRALLAFSGVESFDIVAGAGADLLRGGEYADRLSGGAGDDHLEGGAGADWLWGGLGQDELAGGSGDDVLLGGQGADEFHGGAGIDTVSYRDARGPISATISTENGSAWDGVEVDNFHSVERVLLSDFADRADGYADGDGVVTLYGFGGNDILEARSGKVRLYGGAGHDQLIGDDADDILSGGDGTDWLEGGDGSDWVYGGDGDDRLEGGAGRDLLYGGEGDNDLYGGAGDDILANWHGGWRYIDGGEGVDTLSFRGQEWGSYFWSRPDDIVGIERVLLSDREDHVEGGTDLGETVYGYAGDDRISLSGGRDHLYGGPGDDWLYGGDGADWIYPGFGFDELYGGRGADWFVLRSFADFSSEYPDYVWDLTKEDVIDLSMLDSNLSGAGNGAFVRRYDDAELQAGEFRLRCEGLNTTMELRAADSARIIDVSLMMFGDWTAPGVEAQWVL